MTTTAPSSLLSSSSNLRNRVFTGIVLVLLVILLLLYSSAAIFGSVLILISILGIQEYNQILKNKQIFLPFFSSALGILMMGIGGITAGMVGLQAMLLFGFILLLGQTVFASSMDLEGVQKVGLSILGLLWIGWSLQHFTLLKELPDGEWNLFFLIVVIVLTDSLAYFGGKTWGKTPLAPSISPKKTREGSICGTIGAAIVGALIAEQTLGVSWWNGLLLALILAIISQIGDLAEPRLKRICEVKDSGTILPGHGGILDRLDGYLVAAPCFYYWMVW